MHAGNFSYFFLRRAAPALQRRPWSEKRRGETRRDKRGGRWHQSVSRSEIMEQIDSGGGNQRGAKCQRCDEFKHLWSCIHSCIYSKYSLICLICPYMSNRTRLRDVSGVKFNPWTKHKKKRGGGGGVGGSWQWLRCVQSITKTSAVSGVKAGLLSTGLSMKTNEDEGNSWRRRASVIPPLSVYSRVPLPPLPSQTLPVINNLLSMCKGGELCGRK